MTSSVIHNLTVERLGEVDRDIIRRLDEIIGSPLEPMGSRPVSEMNRAVSDPSKIVVVARRKGGLIIGLIEILHGPCLQQNVGQIVTLAVAKDVCLTPEEADGVAESLLRKGMAHARHEGLRSLSIIGSATERTSALLAKCGLEPDRDRTPYSVWL